MNIMKNSSCELILQSYPKVSEVEYLRWTNLINCVVNNFLSYTAIMLNIVTVHAIRKTSSLPKTLKTLLLNLVVTDVGVGLFVQSIYTSLLIKWLQQNSDDCNFRYAFVMISSTFCLASFLGVVAVSVDRFLAIHLHLRYQELVTHKRVVGVVISLWLLSVIFPVVVLWLLPDMYSLMTFILGIVGLVLTTLVYIRIYLTVRRHKNQIQALQVQQEAENNEMASFASLVKSAVGIFYVYLVFLIRYLPFLICLVATEISGPSIPLKSWFVFSLTLISQFIFEPCNILLEGETHSTRCHEHTAEHVLAQKSRITLILGPSMLCHIFPTFIVVSVDKRFLYITWTTSSLNLAA